MFICGKLYRLGASRPESGKPPPAARQVTFMPAGLAKRICVRPGAYMPAYMPLPAPPMPAGKATAPGTPIAGTGRIPAPWPSSWRRPLVVGP